MPITDTDRGAKALSDRLAAAAKTRPVVDVGVLGDASGKAYTDSGTTTVEVATWNEFGIGVPERSFIRAYVDENRAELEGRLQKMGKALIAGEIPSINIGLEGMGALIAVEIVKRIRDGIEPDNSEATKIRKAGSASANTTPLIDTGQLVSSINHQVRLGGGS